MQYSYVNDFYISGPIAGMTAEIETLLSDLQAVESSLSQVSTGAMADATRVLGVVKEIEQQTNDAKTTAEAALKVMDGSLITGRWGGGG